MTRRKFLTLVALLALILRGGAVVSLRHIHAPPDRRTTGADGVEYNLLGLHMAQGLGYCVDVGHLTSFRAPGFPLFLALIYSLSPANYPAVYVCLCIMGAISCIATYYLARAMLSERGARAAAVLCAVYPPYIYFASCFDSENICAVFLVISMWLFVEHRRNRSLPALIGSALTLGYCALIRPFSILLMVLLAADLFLRRLRSGWPALGLPLLYAVMFSAVVLPWTLRNYRVHGHFVLIATNGGSTFYGGNNDIVSTQPRLLGAWVSTTELPGRAEIDQTPNEYAHDQLEWHLGEAWVRHHLHRMPFLEACKLIRLWMPDIESPNKKYVLMELVGYTPFLLAFLVGLYSCCTDRQYRTGFWTPIHLVVVATILTGLIFWGSPRFRDVNAPVLMLYAAVAYEKWAARRARLAVAAIT
jgi:4-amino-4-deoxy-L-arabinose transferase-like glycosyltransferase